MQLGTEDLGGNAEWLGGRRRLGCDIYGDLRPPGRGQRGLRLCELKLKTLSFQCTPGISRGVRSVKVIRVARPRVEEKARWERSWAGELETRLEAPRQVF